MKIELQPFQRQHLKGLAQTLNPVVMIGNNGLSDSVLREIAISLDAHELIKIRVQGDDRAARIALYEQICDELGAAPVQHIGKLLVLWRPSDKQRIVLPKNKKALKIASQS
jgi:RNA-binding protein